MSLFTKMVLFSTMDVRKGSVAWKCHIMMSLPKCQHLTKLGVRILSFQLMINRIENFTYLLNLYDLEVWNIYCFENIKLAY